MANEDVWERPIGLTAEYAICIDESDEESCAEQKEVASKSKNIAPCSIGNSNNSISSYFHNNALLNDKCKLTVDMCDEGVASENDDDGKFKEIVGDFQGHYIKDADQ